MSELKVNDSLNDMKHLKHEVTLLRKQLEKREFDLQLIMKNLISEKGYVELLYRESPLVIIMWSIEGVILNYNDFFGRYIGDAKNVIGDKYYFNKNLSFLKETFDQLTQAVLDHGDSCSINSTVTNLKGESKDIKWRSKLFYDDELEEDVIITFGVDFTYINDKEKELIKAITYDAVTGLKNINCFEIEIEQISKKNHTAVFQIHIDSFRKMNEFYGRDFGKCLIEKIGLALGEIDNLNSFRLYGSGFIAYILSDDLSEIDIFQKKIKNSIGNIDCINNLHFTPTVTIGVVRPRFDGESLNQIYTNLGLALEDAQLNGINTFRKYDKSLGAKNRSKYMMEKEIHKSLINKEFTLNFQPIINMSDKSIRGLEVLLRWPNNVLNELNIGHVIQLAEQTGQILEIDKYVLNTTIETLNSYNDKLIDKTISINVSAQSFFSDEFFQMVQRVLSNHEISYSLEFEVTEYTIIDDKLKAFEIMTKFKKLGIKFALDDFGTKYSSLNYLIDLPFDILKIDKSYIDIIKTNKNSLSIVKNIINLCKDLDLEVVCEGVEDENQDLILSNVGSNFAQGYYYSKPKRIEELIL